MLKLIPSFSYSYTLDVLNTKRNLALLRDRFISKNAIIKEQTENNFVAEISASSLAKAINVIPDTLCILIQQDNDKLKIEVIRFGEKKVALVFFSIVFVISIAAFIQSHDSKAFLMPILFYIFMWLYSFMPFHPAHKVIRDLARFTDE